MIDLSALLEDDPEANPANWIDGRYVGPAAALVMHARAHHDALKEAHRQAVADRRRQHGVLEDGESSQST